VNGLNGGESTYQPTVPGYTSRGARLLQAVMARQTGPVFVNVDPPAAVSCSLETIADESIELLSFIDQPNYSTVLYVIAEGLPEATR
jgi:hypothetical protein